MNQSQTGGPLAGKKSLEYSRKSCMSDRWEGCARLWQTSPNAPVDRCDLAFVKILEEQLVALVVDGAPGRASARPPWPREAIFEAAGNAFTNCSEPEAILSSLGELLRTSFQGQAWRLGAAAAAISWNAGSGRIKVAEAGDTKVWLVQASAPKPIIEGGLPRRGYTPANMLGFSTPAIRSRTFHCSDVFMNTCLGLALITDGADDILRLPSMDLPGEIISWTLETVGTDDATLLLVKPPR
ncbi:hypothetical protein [Thiorhodovibrio winogradskyi]|uniref:hypothetical protein n=2 Tax=Thiorhodovibrio TaxID=61593 RepID=UPI0019121396|nr:hypothetical protein [Thiorhodovibrio winogradskyi]